MQELCAEEWVNSLKNGLIGYDGKVWLKPAQASARRFLGLCNESSWSVQGVTLSSAGIAMGSLGLRSGCTWRCKGFTGSA